MSEVVEPARSRRWGRRIAIAVAVSAGAMLALAILGVPLPMGLLGSRIESRASQALGRDVQIGSLSLRVGFRPRLSIEQLRIAHPLSGRPEVLSLERLEFEVGLPALLRQRIHVVNASALGVAVVLDPQARADRTRAVPDPEPALEEPASAPSIAGWSLDVQQLELVDLSLVQQLEGRPEPIHAQLDAVRGQLRWDESVALELQGSYEGIPFAAELGGASVADLLDDASAWPASLVLSAAGAEIRIETELARLDDGVRMNRIRGQAGGAPFEGQLVVEGLSGSPRASGRIDVEAIHVSLPEGGAAEVAADDGASQAEAAAAELDLRMGRPLQTGSSGPELEADDGPGPLLAAVRALHGFETDLELTVAGITGLGAPIQELAVALLVEDGELDFPVSVTVADIPLSGRVRLEDRETQAWFGFDLRAEGSRIDTLADLYAPQAHLRGGFGAMSLELDAAGKNLVEHVAGLQVKLAVENAELSYGAGDPRSFELAQLDLVLEERGPLRLEANGSLLGEAARVDLETGGLGAALSDASWPLRIDFEGGGARVGLRGESRRVAGGRQIAASLTVDGEHLAELEPWIGSLPLADSDYRIRTELTSTAGAFLLEIHEARLGETNLTGEIGRRFDTDAPVGLAALEIDRLDFSELADAPDEAPAEPTGEPTGGEPTALELDVPILPGGLKLADSDIDLRIGQLLVGDLELSDLRFEGAIRDSHLPDSTLGLRVGDVALDGSLRLDLRDSPHAAAFVLGAEDVDVGQLLERLGVARGLELTAASLELEIDGEGATLQHVFDQTEVSARAMDAQWTLRDEVSGEETLRLSLAHAILARSGDGEGLALIAEGTLRNEPVALTIRSPAIPVLKRTSDSHPIELTLETGGARLVVDSSVALPIDRGQLDVALRLEGERLDQASTLLGYELPAIGPYLLTSRMQFAREDHQLSDLELRVGESRLRGTGRLSTAGARPRLDVTLSSEVIQIDDFEAATPDGARSEESSSDATAGEDDTGNERPREFMSADGLSSLDGRLELRVDQVLSGVDELGAGRFVASLEDGVLRLDPLQLEVPGGRLELSAELGHSGDLIDAHIRGRIPRFDFGVVARRLDPETDMHGWMALDLDVAGTAPELSRLLSNANGHLDFFAAPQNIETDVFDLWAVNVLSFIVPRLDAGPRSTLNCVVARFDLDDGMLRDQSLFLDTTRMVVNGRAEVDFGEETIHATLRPAPKKAQMFTLQTNVELSGGFDDFRVRVPPEEFVTTFVRFFTSVVATPVQRIFGRRLPADGRETCEAAWQKGEKTEAAATEPHEG